MHSGWTRAFALTTLAAVVLLTSCGARPNSVNRVKDFVADLNKHDTGAAMKLAAANFTLIEANGQTAQGAAAMKALSALPTPITVVSASHEGDHKAQAVLRFGSGPQTTVEFTGNSTSKGGRGGRILQMRISAP
jgi:hypothetical protein